jgi:hypothetical protein
MIRKCLLVYSSKGYVYIHIFHWPFNFIEHFSDIFPVSRFWICQIIFSVWSYENLIIRMSRVWYDIIRMSCVWYDIIRMSRVRYDIITMSRVRYDIITLRTDGDFLQDTEWLLAGHRMTSRRTQNDFSQDTEWLLAGHRIRNCPPQKNQGCQNLLTWPFIGKLPRSTYLLPTILGGKMHFLNFSQKNLSP